MSASTCVEKFSLKPYYRETGQRLGALDFEIHTGDWTKRVDPVLDTLTKGKLDYGHLFTYCFRRFGYPNIGSDDYKAIARWLLTTPHPDLFLNISSSVLPEPLFSIRFLTTEENAHACRQWERQPFDEWVERKLDWVEAQGLPEWMPELLASYQKYEWPNATWRDLYRGYIVLFTPSKDETERFSLRKKTDEEKEQDKILSEFAAQVEKYEEIEPSPTFQHRTADVSSWPDSDPMKPLALAAIETLKDLSTAVRVRDSAINAYGRVKDDADVEVVEEPESAGYGLGELINQAPKESIKLCNLAYQLGEGNIKAGLIRIIEKCQN